MEANRGGHMPDDLKNKLDVPAEKAEDNATEPLKQDEEVKFEDLPPAVQKYVDRERNKASMTAREKAKRDALKDPDVRTALKAELEADATLTAEQKVERRMQEALAIENKALARERLVENGIVGEDLQEILELVVTTDSETTMAKVDKFVSLVKKAVNTESEKLTRTALRQSPKPQTTPTETKAFKDMTFDERQKLKATDYSRFKAEMEKLRVKI